MQIGQQKVVSVTYSLQSSLNGVDFELVEETGTEFPLVFLFGSGQLIPDFENNLSGKVSGDEFSFVIASENAYGPVDDEALVRVGMDMFKVDGVVDMEILRVGNVIPLLDRDGNQLAAKILSIDDETVLLDFNHPLAGHTLQFDGKVVEVREASEEELTHGHAHTPGMHDDHDH
jgi:FKBP-type peptidyl-prolyl cis-trans isomerase SlyD